VASTGVLCGYGGTTGKRIYNPGDSIPKCRSLLICMTKLLHTIAALLLGAGCAHAGEIYYTGFENFPAGNDTIAGTDGWTGSASHAGLGLSGVDAEADHLVIGIGNAAFIGGNNNVLAPTVSRTVNVRRTFNLNPVALDQEVMRFHTVFGIKDSTFAGFQTRRDNFDFAFYNSSGQLIGFMQFDNTTLDPLTQAPAQRVWRSSHNGTALVKVDTGVRFFYDVLMLLSVRINFRTNRWTVSLDDLTLFNDQPFYTGPNARNLGTIAVQMQITGTGMHPVTMQSGPAPDDNYMLFDDFALRLDPVPTPVFQNITTGPAGETKLTWQTEALYHYEVQYTENLTTWRNDLPGASWTASLTGSSPVFTDAAAAVQRRRLYRVLQTAP